ncbi:S8 family serine peptidase [Caedibacter taeniospiralis]|uniref:S8 family serine peptidase n=1 Tax=Caedibacter taeniospiralis TaxID=28907 RepID=UPI0037C05F7A
MSRNTGSLSTNFTRKNPETCGQKPYSQDMSCYEYNYDMMGGTSEAAPWVSAAVADMLSANPSLTPAQITTILRKTASLFPEQDLCRISRSGNKGCIPADTGRLNAMKAVEMAQSPEYQTKE